MTGSEITTAFATALASVPGLTGVYRGTAGRGLEENAVPFAAIYATTENTSYQPGGILTITRDYTIDVPVPATGFETTLETLRRAILLTLCQTIVANKRQFQPLTDSTFTITLTAPDPGSDFALLKIDFGITYIDNLN